MTPKRIGTLAAAVVVALALAPGLAGTAGAQTTSTPYTAYGQGLEPGQVVAAFVGGVECGSDTADANGNWLISIPAEAPCKPQTGDAISFTLDGQATTAAESWKPGGAPHDIAQGTTLALATATPTPTPAAAGMFTGTIGDHGIFPVVWSGGTVAQMVAAAGANVDSMWVYNTGAAIGYTVGAPDFVNAAFLALFPQGSAPAAQIVFLVKP